jgi:hypothetical protein
MVQALSIRTKLIMAMLALMGSVALMGVTADDAHAGVTEIRSVYNNTDKTVYLWNRESGLRITISPNYKGFFNQWVPWCSDSWEFDHNHHIEVGYWENGKPVHKYTIWQQYKWGQDRIRYTALRAYDPNATAMPGMSRVNGRRDLVLFDLDAEATEYSTGVRLDSGQ